jgi:hypothetical protein
MNMSERKAVTLGLILVVSLTSAVCAALMLLGAGGDMVAVAMIVVGGLGVDQLSRLIMSYEPRSRR